MNDEDLLKFIALQFSHVYYDDLTRLEQNIVAKLIKAGYLVKKENKLEAIRK